MTTTSAPAPVAPVAAVRRFNRFYTRQIGVLQEGLLESPFSLAEVRVLYELAHRNGPTAAELARALRIDAGYLSRILRSLEKRALIEKTRAPNDARRTHLRLTEAGRTEFAALDARANEEIIAMLERVPGEEQHRLAHAMRTIERTLGAREEPKPPYLLRTHQPGDMGWVVYRHGVLYAREYGWDERFEALVAQVVADFIRNFDPRLERCWIAEQDGERVGSVFLVKKSSTVAKLRLLLVEPHARGLGIGQRLVDECIRFARQARYQRMTLWTNSVLHAARGIYEAAGFRLVREEPHEMFGRAEVAQDWELVL